jgi:hypothetical protein
MYTYRFTCEKEEKFGPICHNYATACKEATDYVQSLVNNGWIINEGNMDLIQEPYDIILNFDGKIARIIVGKLTFAQI